MLSGQVRLERPTPAAAYSASSMAFISSSDIRPDVPIFILPSRSIKKLLGIAFTVLYGLGRVPRSVRTV